jgi:AraC-like DNA-binding protein
MQLRARTLPFGEVKCQSDLGRRTRLHRHDFPVLGAVEGGGCALYEIGGDPALRLDRGSLLLFGPGIPHRLLSRSGTIRRYRVLHLDPDWLRSRFGDARPLFARPRIDDPGTVRRFHRLCVRLIEEESRALEAELSAFLRPLLLPRNPVAAPGKTPDPIPAVREHLELHPAEEFRLDELARLYGIDRYRLIRRFKEAYGLTPRQYLINLRIHRVKRMLEAGMELSEAALENGFYDQSHLYPYFHGVFGVSPAAYLRALRSRPPAQ